MKPALVLLMLAVPAAAPAQALPDSVMVAHFIDIGQGSAVLLEFSCGAVMLDAGAQTAADSRRLADYLTAFFQRRSDLPRRLGNVIITHNHIDHTRALREVDSVAPIGVVIEHGMRGGRNDPGDRALLWFASVKAANMIVDLNDAQVEGGGFTSSDVDPVDCAGTNPQFTVLSADLSANPGWPAADFRDKNNHSLVVRLDFGRSSFLFSGDLEAPAIETLVDFYAGSHMLDVDVYHVGHHGSHNATTWSLLNAIRDPLIAVMTSGRCDETSDVFTAWAYGHPRAVTVDMLRAAISRRRTPRSVLVADGTRHFHRTTMRDAIYASGWDGTITVRATRGGRYEVRTTRSGPQPDC